MSLSSSQALRGFGLGLRPQHYEAALGAEQTVDWFEIISENYLQPGGDMGGKPLWYLDRIAERYPLAMHGVALSIGGCDALDTPYLEALAALARRVRPAWISDHLCWTGVDGRRLHDLLPLPYTDEALRHVVRRLREVQDRLGQQILIENVSSYLEYAHSSLSEWEFLAAVSEEADCLLLLDVNNVYVSSQNHGFDARRYIDALPAQRVRQIHLAGHSRNGALLIDTHDAPVPPEVWSLYAYTIARLGPVPTMIERDAEIPAFEVLVQELAEARRICSGALRARGMNAPELLDLQRSFQGALVARSAAPASLREGGVGRAERFEVYVQAYRLRLSEVLENDFPLLAAVLGGEGFRALAGRYVEVQPSQNASVRWFGQQFPRWLGEQSATAMRADPAHAAWDGSALAEIARFEWAQGEVFDAADEPLLELETLTSLPGADWPCFAPRLRACQRRLQLLWNVPALARLGAEAATEWRAERSAQPTVWLLWRNGHGVHWRSLADDEAVALDALADGVSFAELCERLCACRPPEEVALRAASLMRLWIEQGLLAPPEPIAAPPSSPTDGDLK